MRKWIPVFVTFFLMVGGIWFWSLGVLPEEQVALARIEQVSGDVTRRPKGSSDVIIGKIGDELNRGDVIETGANGTAIIHWLDQGESRLSTSTRIQIEALSNDEEGMLDIRLKLEVGRIWMRMQSLLDLESTVSMQTSDVIATVRGTSFDVSKPEGKETTIWVSDSVVEALATSTEEQAGLFIVEGSMAKFSDLNKATSTMPISASGTQSAWFIENKQADEQFDTRQRENVRRYFGLDQQKRSLQQWASDLSQGLRGPEARARILLRRLAKVIDLSNNGAEGKAAEDFSKLERYVKTQIESGDQRMKVAVRRALLRSRYLFKDVLPDSPSYRYKQAMEEWRIRLARTEKERLSARILAINDQIEEARMVAKNQQTDLALQLSDIAEKSLENISRELENTELPERAAQRAKSRIQALQARVKALEKDARSFIGPSLPNAPTSTTMQMEGGL